MSGHNKVVWSEGLFLQPQHFQQQDRYFERFVEARCQSLIPHSWGLTEFELERDLLGIGKLALRRASGVFPDGTPFRMPEDDPLPPAIDVGAQTRDQIVFLALPLRRPGAADVGKAAVNDDLVRHDAREWEVRDTASASGGAAVLEVGALRTRIVFSDDVTDAYACIPIAHLVEVRGGQVVLDDTFIPTVLRARASARLASFATEVVGLLRQRGDALSARAAGTARGGTAEIAEFLMLQAINRYEPLLKHYVVSDGLHPEALFLTLASIVGELSTFSATSRRPPALTEYRHERLTATFESVMAALRAVMTHTLGEKVVSIPLELKRYGIRVATVSDNALYTTADFILAARANIPAEELRRGFPAHIKIGPVDKISNLVNLSLPGVPVNAIPVAPPQIPYHAGFAYFELDQSHALWTEMPTGGGIALHVAGDFPGLALEFWAIRRS